MGIVHVNCRIARGVTRRVLLIGQYALKVPNPAEWRLFLLGLLANMQEAIFAKARWPELCPVVWSLPGGFLVVMRRARVLTDDEFEEHEALIRRWIFGGPGEENERFVPAEPKSDSFGWLDGRLVAVDYGN